MSEVIAGVLLLAVVALVAIGAERLRARFAAARLRRYQAGEPQRISVRVKGSAPFPGRWAWGSVDTGERPMRFRRWHRIGGSGPLDRMTLVRTNVQLIGRGGEPMVVYRLRGDAGQTVDVAVPEVHAELVRLALRGDAGVGRRRPRPGPAALLFGALSLLWLAGWAYLLLAGSVVDATVLANDEDFCHVEWQLDGRRHDASVDCYGQQPGEHVDVIALPAPFTGEAADPATTAFFVPVLTVLGLLPLGWSLLRRLRYRPPPAGATVTPPVTAEAAVPRIAPDELTYPLVVATVTRRAEEEAWDLAEGPWWLRRFRTSRARLVAASLPSIVGAPLFAALFVLLIGWTPATTALRYDAAAARELTATVTTVDGFAPPIPWDVEVELDVDGRRETVRVAVTREPAAGDRVRVRYDAANDVARAVDHDGVARGIAAAATLAAGALLFALWRARVLAGALRRYRRLRDQPGVPMRYALAPDTAGDPFMLLFGDDGRPGVVLPLGPLPAGVPVAGDAVVHGRAADGERVLVRVGGVPLYPNAPAMALDDEELTDLVNGDLVEFGDEDDLTG